MPKRRFGLHTIRRDAESVRHHYDVSNRFYELVLGPAMTYSCALFDPPEANLAEAQAAKHELICRKLGLRPGMRLLDVGCGWGAMARHAATHHGVEVVGVTISPAQLEWARAAIEAEGLADRVDIRLQDYREVDDGPFDAISSIGMFEHVGAERMQAYFGRLHDLLAPGGRLLNHAISRPAGQPPGIDPDSFIGRYVFPDGELIEVGTVVTAMQRGGLRGPPRREPAGALRPHAAALGGQPRAALGRGRRRGRRDPGPDLAPLHGGLGGRLRGRPHPGPPGARA